MTPGPLRVAVVSTALQRGPVKTLSTLVVSPSGEVSAPYDEQHLDVDETPLFTHGDHGASVTVDAVEMGLSICYDSSFSEHARAAADDGASAYLCSAAFFPGGGRRRDRRPLARLGEEEGLALADLDPAVVAGPTATIGGSRLSPTRRMPCHARAPSRTLG